MSELLFRIHNLFIQFMYFDLVIRFQFFLLLEYLFILMISSETSQQELSSFRDIEYVSLPVLTWLKLETLDTFMFYSHGVRRLYGTVQYQIVCFTVKRMEPPITESGIS